MQLNDVKLDANAAILEIILTSVKYNNLSVLLERSSDPLMANV